MDGCSHRGEHQEFNGNMQPCVHRSGDQHFVLAVDAAQVVTAAVHNKSRAVFTVCFLFTYTPFTAASSVQVLLFYAGVIMVHCKRQFMCFQFYTGITCPLLLYLLP
jgi:hypothetical protein